jgi:methyl-accepting chemotaxis protein
MKLTLGQRIALGFGLLLALITFITAGAVWQLGASAGAYESAMREREREQGPAYDADTSARSAHASYLRFLLEGDGRYVDDWTRFLTRARVIVAEARGRGQDPTIQSAWDETAATLERWSEAVTRSIAAARAGKTDEALRLRREEVQPAKDTMDAAFRRSNDLARERSDRAVTAAQESRQRTRTLLILAGLAALVIGTIAAWQLVREIGRSLREASGGLATGATEILAAATQQASGANESLAAITETVATVDEITRTADQAAQRARQVAESAQKTAEIGRVGRKAVEDSQEAMAQVKAQVESIAERILALTEQAQAIAEIVETVNEIAEQTNLLALNAAVEAARAGEQGRGFAVLATEVKDLAQQSKRATVQVGKLLGDVQRATSAAVMVTEQGTKQVATGVRLVGEAGDTIRSLAAAVSDAAQASSQIVASAGQQAIGMEQIRQAVANIQQAMEQNLASTRQTEDAASRLTALGNRLLATVGGRPRLRPDEGN